MKSQNFIILIDDDQNCLDTHTKLIQTHTSISKIIQLKSGEELLTFIHQHPAEIPDHIFIDFLMPGLSGIETINQLFSIQPKVKAVLKFSFLTSVISLELKNFAAKHGINVLSKPFSIEDAIGVISF